MLDHRPNRSIQDDDLIVTAMPGGLYRMIWQTVKHDRQILLLEHHVMSFADYRVKAMKGELHATYSQG
jgi:hypothetical protein